MIKVFTRTFRVRWSEVDASGQVGPAAYLRYLVETAYDWAIAGGLGEADGSNPLGLLWMIRESEINFIAPLSYNEIFDFTIWMVSWQRVRGIRAFEMVRKSDGAIIAQGTQQIVSFDAATLRPLNLPEHLLEKYRIEEPRQFPVTRFPRLSAPPASAQVTQRVVEWADLDQMEHVNNAIYLDYVDEATAQDFATRGWNPVELKNQNRMVTTRRVHIQYQSPALWCETLNINTYPLSLHESGGSCCVSIIRATDGTAIAECIVDWEMLNSQTGQPCPLPIDLAASLKQDLPVE
jgi:acyl-CoA thioester hydrolase